VKSKFHFILSTFIWTYYIVLFFSFFFFLYRIATFGSDIEDREKLPITEAPTRDLSERSDSSIGTKNCQFDDIINVSASISSSDPTSSLPINTAHSEPSMSTTSNAHSIKIVKVNKTKKAESSDHSSGTESPIPSTATTQDTEITTEINTTENKTTKVEPVKTKSRVKMKARPQKCKR
jgi:hypothetical protein